MRNRGLEPYIWALGASRFPLTQLCPGPWQPQRSSEVTSGNMECQDCLAFKRGCIQIIKEYPDCWLQSHKSNSRNRMQEILGQKSFRMMISAIQEASLGNFPTLHCPPPYSHLAFLRDPYVPRNLGIARLTKVDPEWLGSWITEQERKRIMGNYMPVLADEMRNGWRLEQERRVVLCDRCLPGTDCIRHPDKPKKRFKLKRNKRT